MAVVVVITSLKTTQCVGTDENLYWSQVTS